MEITQTTFGPRHYLAVRHSIPIAKVTDKEMYDLAYARLFGYMGQRGVAATGPAAVVYLKWDEAAGQTDLAIAIPVDGIEETGEADLVVLDIPETPAVTGVLHGSYDGLMAAHQEIGAYLREHALQYHGWTVEEYVSDPMTEKDPARYVTNISYLAK